MKIRTQKVWFGSGFHLSNSESTVVNWLTFRAKPNILGTNFMIGSLIYYKSLSKSLISERKYHAITKSHAFTESLGYICTFLFWEELVQH